MATTAQTLANQRTKPVPSNIEGNYEITNYYMQNKPNFQKSQMNVSIFSQKAYENFCNWTLGENKPNQTQFHPKNEANKPKTNPISIPIMKKQTQSNPILSAIAFAKADSKRDTLLLKFRQGTVKLLEQKAGLVHLINGQSMSENRLKTAVLGLNDKGQVMLKAAAGSEQFEIAAVADKDTNLAEETALKYNCKAYDDYRQLIIQNQFDCLLVAAGMHSCGQYLRAAMKKKFNILKLAPPARNFEEAVEFVQLAEDENIKFAVGNPSRFAQSFTTLQQFLEQDKIEQIFLVSAFWAIGNKQHPSWQTDLKLAGGGVLLHNCYDIIDQIVCNFAIPQQVYSLNTNTAGDRGQRLYLTEDTAVTAMKFTDSSFGNLIASKVFGPEEKLLKLYGKDKILTVSNNRFIISDCHGQVSEELKYDDDELCWYMALLKNFASSILSPDKNKLCSSGAENLKDMAVIESAYLSARTGMPEEPGKILEMASRHTSKPINI